MINGLLKKALSQCGVIRLKRRIKKIRGLNSTIKPNSLPCTYLKPSFDLFINLTAIKHLNTIFTSINIVEISGSHFLLQSNPTQCWRQIQKLAEDAPAN